MDQLQRRKWNCPEQALRDNRTVKLALQWTLQDHKRRATKEYMAKRCREKCRQQVSVLQLGGRWRWQHNTKLNGDKWSVANAVLGVTTHKSSLNNTTTPRNMSDYYNIRSNTNM